MNGTARQQKHRPEGTASAQFVPKLAKSCLLRLETNEIGGGFGRVSSGYHPLDGEGEQPTTESRGGHGQILNKVGQKRNNPIRAEASRPRRRRR